VARVGTFEWNIQTGVNTWTPELEVIYGLPPGGFAGTEEAWELLVHPEDRQEATRRVEQAMETGKFEAEWRVIWPDGTLRWLAGRALVFKDEADKPLRLIGGNIDITEAKQAGEELRQASEQRRLALEAAELGAWDYHFETGDVFWDDACCHMFAVPPGRISDEEALSRIHSEDRPAVRESLAQALAGANNGSYHHEFRVRWADGTVHWIVSHGRVQFGEKGGLRRALRFTGVNADITERKQAELEIRQLNSELEKRVRERTVQLEIANKELEAFAYSVSHDLRAPLRGIDGWSLALAEDYAAQLDQRAHGYIDRVRSETQRMGFLIDAMLQLSKVSRADMQLVPVNLTDAARGIASRLSEANSSRTIEFVIQPGLCGIADARLLEIALTNLLANAVKFTAVRAHSRIEFGQASHNGQPAFYVRDNGVGFDMTYAGKLFSAFHRLHKTSEFPGTGIGLATVQRVIHRHAGRVWAEAQVDRGATFYFTIGETL
jgi:PAS domain S-box-containing protein